MSLNIGGHFVGDGFGDWKNAQRLANHATSSNRHVDCVHMVLPLLFTLLKKTSEKARKKGFPINGVFCILIDELVMLLVKNKWLLLFAVNNEGLVKERFLGIVSVKETSAKSLKEELEKLLSINGLGISSIRGQGYDGASNIRGFTNDLSVALQKRDQDLLNALSLINATKQELQEMGNDGWKELISKVMQICNKLDIDVPDTDTSYVQGKKLRLHATTYSISNFHHYKHGCLFNVLDLQLHELNARMVELYPNDFVDVPEVVLRHQLQNYVRNVRCGPKFAKLKGLSDLSAKNLETNK
ncbi:uncharacterized protein LOC131605505 [Vicia villosa]|uniref:uncharacterized protein LOC131605505 n=1 Tax=Vicia villosa TaxID=3911 RepID=UPI00273BF985|nr:uncharacterized protein LOC131605505 [Vicia villosa]